MPYLESPDANLFYRVDDHTDPWTKPETVLFVHGFTETHEAWHAWVPHFSRRYRMVRIDQRGFGRSGPVAKDFPLSTELFVDDLVRLINHLSRDEPVHVVVSCRITCPFAEPSPARICASNGVVGCDGRGPLLISATAAAMASAPLMR